MRDKDMSCHALPGFLLLSSGKGGTKINSVAETQTYRISLREDRHGLEGQGD